MNTSANTAAKRMKAAVTTLAVSLPLVAAVLVTTAPTASASCVDAGNIVGTWRSSDDSLSRIDIWQGNSCGLYIRGWETCEHDAGFDCPWDVEEVYNFSRDGGTTPVGSYEWKNAFENIEMLYYSDSTMLVRDTVYWDAGGENTELIDFVKD